MQYNIIATGSQGNAVVINEKILIDCGVPFRALREVYKKLKIVLLTHQHTDHLNKTTIKRLADERPTLRFGCGKWLVNILVDAGVPKKNIDVYEIGKIYDYAAFKMSAVKLYHDVENCGYRLFVGKEKAIYCTDTRTLQGITAKDYDLYLIEANYSEEEIAERIREKEENGEFVYERRVLRTHLSHEEASDFLLKNMGNHSEYSFLHQHIHKD